MFRQDNPSQTNYYHLRPGEKIMIGNLEPEERLLNLESDELQADLAEIYNDIEQLAFRIYMTGYNKGLKQQSK